MRVCKGGNGNICVPSHQYVSSCVSATYVCSCVQELSHWSNFKEYVKASRQCASFCEFAMHQRKWKCNCTVCSYVAVILHASTSCAFLDYAREALVTLVCLLTSMCNLVFLQLMYVLVCNSYHIGQTLSNTKGFLPVCVIM